jgi:hypothetical protein
MINLGYRGVICDAMAQSTSVKQGCGEDGSSIDDPHSMTLTEMRYISPVLCSRNEGMEWGPALHITGPTICRYCMIVNPEATI